MDNTTVGIYVILAVLLLLILFALLFWSFGYWGAPVPVVITPLTPGTGKDLPPVPLNEANANAPADPPVPESPLAKDPSVVEPVTDPSSESLEAVTGESAPSFDALTQATLNHSRDQVLIKDVASSAWTKTRD